MKNTLVALFLTASFSCFAYANGVAILDAHSAVYLRLDSAAVAVSVQGQISVTTTTQYFTNTQATAKVKYAFPLSESASAVQLRCLVNGVWNIATVSGHSQDTTLPGEGTADPALLTYLGSTPLYFSIPDSIGTDSTLGVELTYVELLPYAFGNVNYVYPSDYQLIQSNAVAMQRFDFHLNSPRTIDSIRVLSGHPVTELVNYGNDALVHIILHEAEANENYSIRYSLSANELGLFAFSSMFPDTLVPDSLGRGFLTFIAEPDPGITTSAIAKVFTLIIDRSGSMSGTKMEQAKDAASFIVRNLNEGDRFNLIDFDNVVTSFRSGHVLYTPEMRDSALAYISNLFARNNTSISGAFATAVPQFVAANDSTANIIIFFTDGLPTSDITDPGQLVHFIDTLIISTETNIYVFSFGIGPDVNKQLLTLISSHNRGLAEFLGNDELYSSITNFYMTVRNPVLLNSHISFDPPVVTETYPDSLPNLYKGKQMIIAGRYRSAVPVQITFSGSALGRAVSYDYTVQLSDSSVAGYQFLPKVWAKRKIEALLIRYYISDPLSEEANALRDQIIALSQAYGVISPFTSFEGYSQGGTGRGVGVEEQGRANHSVPIAFELLGNYPNPFNPSTIIRFRLNTGFHGIIDLRIYNILGQLVRTLHIWAYGEGTYDLNWDGHSEDGKSLPSGVYVYAVEFGNAIFVGKMTLLK